MLNDPTMKPGWPLIREQACGDIAAMKKQRLDPTTHVLGRELTPADIASVQANMDPQHREVLGEEHAKLAKQREYFEYLDGIRDATFTVGMGIAALEDHGLTRKEALGVFNAWTSARGITETTTKEQANSAPEGFRKIVGELGFAGARLIDVAQEMYEALKAYETLDDFHANCEECEASTEAPELCEACFPYADNARLKMRAAIAKVEGRDGAAQPPDADADSIEAKAARDMDRVIEKTDAAMCSMKELVAVLDGIPEPVQRSEFIELETVLGRKLICLRGPVDALLSFDSSDGTALYHFGSVGHEWDVRLTVESAAKMRAALLGDGAEPQQSPVPREQQEPV